MIDGTALRVRIRRIVRDWSVAARLHWHDRVSRGIALPLQLVLGALGIAVIVVPAVLVHVFTTQDSLRIAERVAHGRHRVIPRAEVPSVDPIELVDLAPDDARAINASVPFSTLPNPAARPFRIFGTPEDQERATDCLAAAVLYEAGDDAIGERAVAQVVLNRVRHPAFPNSVCGVVFQGAERRTGCQFTFTCDGAMARIPSAPAWARARQIARNALNGQIFRPVGHATHYHTDWVVPYWSASLEKITAVDTHLFFRWTGWWGRPGAFAEHYTGVEPVVPQLRQLSAAHGGTLSPELAAQLSNANGMDPAAIPESAVPQPVAGDPDSFLVTLDRSLRPDDLPALAIRACGERTRCKFMAWTDRAQTPRQLPLDTAQVARMAFSYLRDERLGAPRALWNCALYTRPSPVQCMRVQPLPRPETAPTPAPAARAMGAEEDNGGLSGVHRVVRASAAQSLRPVPESSPAVPIPEATPR